MLPHLAGRPVTMVRLPDGVEGERFFEKRCPGHRPAWLRTVPLDADSAIAGVLDRDVPGLVWTANLAALELHTPQATADDPLRPTAMVFDLDPGAPPTSGLRARRARAPRPPRAARPRAVAKTSGSKGLHVSVGLRPSVDAEATKASRSRWAAARATRPEARDRDDGTRPAAGQGVRRLEPERPTQDDGVRVLAARDAESPGVDTAVVGRGRRPSRDGDGDAHLRARRRARRVGEHGDLYADSLAQDQELPELAQ